MLSDSLLQKDCSSSTPSEAGTSGSTAFEHVELNVEPNDCHESEDLEVAPLWQGVCLSVFGIGMIVAIIMLGICNGFTCTN